MTEGMELADADGRVFRLKSSGPSSGFDVVRENGEWVTRYWVRDMDGNLISESREPGWPNCFPGWVRDAADDESR